MNQLLALLLVFTLPVFNTAKAENLSELSDSIGFKLRLKAHLLIRPESIGSELIDSLLLKAVPVAIVTSEKQNSVTGRLKQKFQERNQPFVVVYEDRQMVQEKTDPEAIKIENIDKLLASDFPGLINDKISSRDFLWVTANSDSLPDFEYFIRLWEITGKLPNFIESNTANIFQAVELITRLNHHPKILGVVKNGDQLLTQVSWKDFPGRKTNGYFCFPTTPGIPLVLIPYRAGYQFSPDIIFPTPENINKPKVFNAVPLNQDFGLTDHFTFSKKLHNLQRKNDDEIIDYGLVFGDNGIRANCAFFPGNAYADCGLKSRSSLKPNFTISVWIKPTKLTGNNCIVGKGKDFVLKIRNGKLTFTVQGVKDYQSDRTIVEQDKWNFVAIVHSAAENKISFYKDGKLTDQISLLAPYNESDYTLLIGSNLWEEFFIGYIDELKIWDRELNEDQVKTEFLSNQASNKRPYFIAFMAAAAILGGAFRYVLFRRRKTAKQSQGNSQLPEISARQPDEIRNFTVQREQIICFGGLKVINQEGKDISLKFSPKIKQLFVLILLHSIGEEKGISSKKINDYLWPGMSAPRAKNIRGTNIQNMKTLMASCTGVKLVFEDKLWKLEFSDDCFVDVLFVEKAISRVSFIPESDNSVVQLTELLQILKKGQLLPTIEESWIDPFVDKMSDRIIEFGLGIFRSHAHEKYDTVLLDAAEVISLNDPLNEVALRQKVNILIRQGKLSLAHSIFDNFTRLYFELYQEKYTSDFKSLVDRNHHPVEE
jgi:hypothetical protein